MRAMAIAVCVSALGLSAWMLPSWAQGQAAEKAEAKVAEVSEAPKIDGVLDDAVWQKATEIKSFKTSEGEKPKIEMRMLLARDGKNLYVAIESFEPAAQLKKLVADTTDRDGETLWEDDDIEIFIDPTNKRQNYYQLLINSKNVVGDYYLSAGDAESRDASWNPKYEHASKIGEKSWVVEFAIPYEAFDRTAASATEWGFNVLRTRNLSDGGREYVYWSPTGDSAHVPAKFGTISNMTATWKDREVKKGS